MDNTANLQVHYDEEHVAEDAEQREVMEDQLSLAESSSSVHVHPLPVAEESPDGIFWGILAAFCFVAGLSIGLFLYFKSSLALKLADWMRRCCPKISRATTQDPVLLTIVDRETKDGQDEDDKHSEGSSSDEGESKSDKKSEDDTKVTVHKSEGDRDGVTISPGKEEGDEGEQGASDKHSKDADKKQGEGATEAEAKTEDNKDNEETNKEEAKKAQEDDKKSNSSSSSSSSSDEDEEKSSVRHRKTATTEATPTGETAPPSEDQGDTEHKE